MNLSNFFRISLLQIAEAYSETSRTSKMTLFTKIVNGIKPLTTFAKRSILDTRLGSGYAPETGLLLLDIAAVKADNQHKTNTMI